MQGGTIKYQLSGESQGLLQQGGESVFAQLCNHYHHPLLRHGLRILPDTFEVQSLVQEVLLKAWDFRGRLSSPAHFYRFCRMNLRWHCYNHYRKQQKIISTDKWEHYYVQQDVPDRDMEERLDKIFTMTGFLSPKRKKMVHLYYEQGYSLKQIAAQFSTTPQAVRVELQKSVAQLQQMLQVQPKQKPSPSVPTADTIWTLRMVHKRSFESIATELNLPLAAVQQHYIKMLSRA